MSIAYKLKKDPNKNVNSNFDGIDEIKETYFEEEDENINSTNYLFVEKMTILKEEFGITKNLPLNAKIRGPESPKKKSISYKSNLNVSLANLSAKDSHLSTDKLMIVDDDVKKSEVQSQNESMDIEQIDTVNKLKDNSNIQDKNENNKINEEEL
jgi:hypothetical protein